MRISDVEVFRAVMTAGTATKAALALAVSQPAVSQAIKRLEQEAGIALFERIRGRLWPRPEARAFLIEVDRCFVSLETLEHRLASLRQFSVNDLKVASYPALGLGYLPRVIAKLVQKNTELRISLQVLSSREVRERVLSGLCEFGLMADEVSTAGLQACVLFEALGVIAMAEHHPLARNKTISAKQFLSYPHIALNPEDTSSQRLKAELGTLAKAFKPVVETPYGVSICELAINNVGIGLVNPLVARQYRGRGLVTLPFALKIPFRALLATQPNQPLSALAQQFLVQLRRTIAADQR